MITEQDFKYTVALSFAGEQRDYVERVAHSLKGFGIKFFYDSDETPMLWGANGIESLDVIYGTESRYVIMFVSDDYIKKPWCKVERRAALDARLERDDGSVLQVAFDKVKVPGIPSSEIYVEAKNYSPEELAILFCKKLGIDLSTQKATTISPPTSPEEENTIRFGHASYGGRYLIGRGDWSFELLFNTASSESIYLSNYTSTVRGIAVAPDCWAVSDVKDAGTFDFTSPTVVLNNGSLVVIQNHLGFYALLRVEYIADKSRGTTKDEIIFSYRILRDRGVDFSEVTPFHPLAPSIALEFDISNGMLGIHNTFNEPIKWYALSTHTSGSPPPPNLSYREQKAMTIAQGKWLSYINCPFEMAPLQARTTRINNLHMDFYISDSVNNFYRVGFILKMTCRGNAQGEAALIRIETQLESREALEGH